MNHENSYELVGTSQIVVYKFHSNAKAFETFEARKSTVFGLCLPNLLTYQPSI
jgi:hypothetical protein